MFTACVSTFIYSYGMSQKRYVMYCRTMKWYLLWYDVKMKLLHSCYSEAIQSVIVLTYTSVLMDLTAI